MKFEIYSEEKEQKETVVRLKLIKSGGTIKLITVDKEGRWKWELLGFKNNEPVIVYGCIDKNSELPLTEGRLRFDFEGSKE